VQYRSIYGIKIPAGDTLGRGAFRPQTSPPDMRSQRAAFDTRG
jgi:hypothetical protein